MKNITIISLVVTFIVLFLVSCQNESFIEDSSKESNQEFITRTFFYDNEYHTITYIVSDTSNTNLKSANSKKNPDENLKIEDKESIKKVEMLNKALKNPNVAIWFISGDETMYVFDSPAERNKFKKIKRPTNSNPYIDTEEVLQKLINPEKKEPAEVRPIKDSVNFQHFVNKIGRTNNKMIVNGPLVEMKKERTDSEIKLKSANQGPGSSKIFLIEHAHMVGDFIECISMGKSVSEGYNGFFSDLNGYGINDLSGTGFNDVISSIYIKNLTTRDLTVILWTDANYSGASIDITIQSINYDEYNSFEYADLQNWEYSGDWIWQSYTFNDKISSVEWCFMLPQISFIGDDYNFIPDWRYKSNCYEYSASTPGADASCYTCNNALNKTATSGWYGSSASGAITFDAHIPAYYNGSIEVVIPENYGEFMFGLSYEYTPSPSWYTIDFAINNSITFGRTARFYRRGTYSFSSDVSFEPGDVLRLERNGWYVNSYINNTPIGRVSADASQKLRFDCSLGTKGVNFICPYTAFFPSYGWLSNPGANSAP